MWCCITEREQWSFERRGKKERTDVRTLVIASAEDDRTEREGHLRNNQAKTKLQTAGPTSLFSCSCIAACWCVIYGIRKITDSRYPILQTKECWKQSDNSHHTDLASSRYWSSCLALLFWFHTSPCRLVVPHAVKKTHNLTWYPESTDDCHWMLKWKESNKWGNRENINTILGNAPDNDVTFCDSLKDRSAMPYFRLVIFGETEISPHQTFSFSLPFHILG